MSGHGSPVGYVVGASQQRGMERRKPKSNRGQGRKIAGKEPGCPKELAGVVKIGPWSGEGGHDWDIPTTPLRLEAITVCSSLAVVDAISLCYWDEQGKKHNAGPWGGNGGDPYLMIRLEPSEFVTEISGTFAYIGTQPTDAVTSLTFVTNLRKHGPFGDVEGDVDGTPFSVQVQDGGSIVGLFGRGWDYIDAIGVYVRA